ncbi:MAG TPA: hypothetical protein VK745_25210 [Polyangiaceae bacterium]|jgi:hypothetical protein|nr:hypothetical protein [Polyangiaceae bacterium]
MALFDLGRRKGFGLRAARLYAFGVFVWYAVALWLARGSEPEVSQGLLHAALVSLSWVVGALGALGTAQISANQSERAGLEALAAQRGFSERDMLRARFLVSSGRVAKLIGVPALCLVGVAVACGLPAMWALVTAPAVALYAVLLGLGLAFLAQFSAELAPRHPRALLAALVLGPVLLSRAYPAIPSLPDALSMLLDRLLRAGAALT